MKIQELEKEFTGTGEVKGFKFTQIDSTDKAYLYEVKNNDIVHYEVIKRKTVKKCIDFEKNIYSETDYKETYPKASRFGVDGYTFKNKEKAINKLKELTSEK